MNQLQNWGMAIYLLIGILALAVLCLVLIVLVWTGGKIAIFKRRQRRAEADHRRLKFHPDGTPIPPVAPGVCHRCGRASARVFHLPAGERLCEECHQPVHVA